MAENPFVAKDADKVLTGAQAVAGDVIVTDDPSFRSQAETSPWLNDRVDSEHSGPTAPLALYRQSFDLSTLGSVPSMPTADLANAVDRFVNEFAKPYDTNKDGVFAGPELHALASAVLDQAGQISPSLVANRETVLAAIDRVGSVSAEQLKSLVNNAVKLADADGNGVVDPQEFQNIMRVAAEKPRER